MDYLVAQFLTFHPGILGPALSASLFGTIKFFLEIFSLALFLLLIFMIYRLSKIRSPLKPHEHVTETLRGSLISTSRISKQWGEIEQRLQRPVEAEWKIAVIEADTLVDDILRRMGYTGTSMGERLKNINPSQFTSLDAVWAGHKVRNFIVHDPNARILYRDAKESIENFKTFLKEIQAL